MKMTTKGKDGIAIPGLPEPVLVSGRGTGIGLGDRVFYVSNGRQIVRRYVKPRDPRTGKQLEHRRVFGEIVKKWRGLPPERKREYELRAENLDMTGFNLFVSEAFRYRQKMGRY